MRYKRRDITVGELIIWYIFWALVLGASWQPHLTDRLAELVGVGRGADLLVYVSILVIFFMLFRIIVTIEQHDRDVTKVVREMGLRDATDNEKLKNEK